jgi:hypothetical protein
MMSKVNGCFPVTRFEMDTYITLLNKQNLPNVNLTVDDATRLKGSKPAQFKKKQGRSILEPGGSVEKITQCSKISNQCSWAGRLEKG